MIVFKSNGSIIDSFVERVLDLELKLLIGVKIKDEDAQLAISNKMSFRGVEIDTFDVF